MRASVFAAIALALAAALAGYFGGLQQGRASGEAVDDAAKEATAKQHAAVVGENAKATAAVASAGKLPAAGTPLKYLFADLQARANAGDVAAATRLYRDVSLCRRFESLDRDNAKLSDELLGQAVGSMNAEQLKNYRAQLDDVESRRQTMDRFRALCDGASSEMLDSLVPNLQRAAQLGEPYARACYLDRGPNYDPASLLDHPERLGSYKRDALAMIEAGVEQGDWRVIDLVRGAYRPGTANFLSAAIGKDPYQRYRYLKLFRMGADSDSSRADADRDIDAVAKQLSAAQITQADAWASKAFEQNFQGKPIGAEGPVWDPCVFPYE